MRPGHLGREIVLVCLVAVLAAGIGPSACGPTRTARPVAKAPLRDVPNVLRGTIGAESDIRGIDPVLVSGLGIVVGLNGTGGGELPVQVLATMERELARGGIGKGAASTDTTLGAISPREFLRRPDVAVVIVQAAVPPGAPEGSTFDVFVRTLPGSGVMSLEGGQLWTTELRIGPAAVFGAVKTRKIAEARGPVFINPFSAPSVGPSGDVQVTQTLGRVLGGGVVSDPLRLELVLDNDSHARARSIVSSINSRFASAGETVAHGRGQSTPQGPALLSGKDAREAAAAAYQSIAVTVPNTYRTRPGEFIELLRHLRVDQSFPQEWAKQYAEALKAEPALAEDLSWCLQAIGKPAIPFLAPLYDYAELVPRMAALGAGARLGDHRTVPGLIELAQNGPPTLRTNAIRLLGEMPPNPAISLALREQLESKDLDVRVAAYEGLRKRGDALVRRYLVGIDAREPRFSLEVVPVGDPLVYVTQQGEARIVLFGNTPAPQGDVTDATTRARNRHGSLMLSRPMITTAFNDGLLMTSESPSTPVRVMYRDPRTGRTLQSMAPDDLVETILFLARRTSPDDPAPGLAMGYSDVVGTLYALTRQGGVEAAFATEEDRLRAEIFEASKTSALADRPEGDTPEGEQLLVFKTLEPADGQGADAPAGATDRLTRVVPLNQPKKKGE